MGTSNNIKKFIKGLTTLTTHNTIKTTLQLKAKQ